MISVIKKYPFHNSVRLLSRSNSVYDAEYFHKNIVALMSNMSEQTSISFYKGEGELKWPNSVSRVGAGLVQSHYRHSAMATTDEL